ncbi:MAG: DUF192 domain-containing protein [Myxococcales bacterium]
MKALHNRTRGAVLATRVDEARTVLARLRGLLGRRALAEGEALLLAPCSSVHTFFMGFPIDVLFLDREGRAVGAIGSLKPWRATRIYGAAACAVELPAGALARSRTREGDAFELAPAQGGGATGRV